MNIQTALLPHKHIPFSRSLIGIAGMLLTLLDEPRTLDELMAAAATRRKDWPNPPSFTDALLAVYVLYAIKQIHLVQGDRIQRVSTAR
jgi:hypothetical protein